MIRQLGAPRLHYTLLLCSVLISLNVAGAQGSDATIIGVAEETPNLSTLLNAIGAAGLTQTLQGTGPYTVFAPTNEAFAKLSDTELSALLSDREALRRVLSYHIVPGSFTTSDISPEIKAQGFATLGGADLPVTEQGVGDATVTTVNIPASNGVLFAIDSVLTPPEAVAEEDTEVPESAETDDALYSSSAEARQRFELTEAGGSGVSGSALIAEYAGERAIVTLSLSGTPTGGEHPAALYAGSCESLSATALVELEPYIGDFGFSTTVVELPYGDVVAGDHALAVSLSPTDPSIVACGEVGP